MLYADMLLYMTIITLYSADYLQLQQDVNGVYQWRAANHLLFSVSKCRSMVIKIKYDHHTPALGHTE